MSVKIFVVTMPGNLNAEFVAWLSAHPDPFVSQIITWAEAHGLEMTASFRGLAEAASEMALAEGVGL